MFYYLSTVDPYVKDVQWPLETKHMQKWNALQITQHMQDKNALQITQDMQNENGLLTGKKEQKKSAANSWSQKGSAPGR